MVEPSYRRCSLTFSDFFLTRSQISLGLDQLAKDQVAQDGRIQLAYVYAFREDLCEHARGPRYHEVTREDGSGWPEDLVGCHLLASRISMVYYVVLKQGGVVCDFNAGSKTSDLFVVWCLFERNGRKMAAFLLLIVIDRLRQEEHDRRAEIFPLQKQVIV